MPITRSGSRSSKITSTSSQTPILSSSTATSTDVYTKRKTVTGGIVDSSKDKPIPQTTGDTINTSSIKTDTNLNQTPSSDDKTTSDSDTKAKKESKRQYKARVIKEKMIELCKLETIINNHSHPDYKALLDSIELKRQEQYVIAEHRRELARFTLVEQYNVERKLTDDQFQVNKLSTRKALILDLKKKMDILEYERYLQDCQSAHWVESARITPAQPTVINILYFYI
ncbi:hypothetical protein BC941DRAFT_420223 [Chlamydoabsidia padenii]|nr:hypothetical protein BC941DRAFT_420223 [Chlamydoabsidia padenii]